MAPLTATEKMTPPATDRSSVRQVSRLGSTDWSTVAAILDAGIVAHVGVAVGRQPFVIPMAYAREGRTLVLHGAAASRLMTTLEQGAEVCAAVTIVDGLVLARSAFHHSMNYRSAVLFGTASKIQEPRAKLAALRLLSDHVLAGRWADVRSPTKSELRETMVLRMEIEEASSKVRSGPPIDVESDLGRKVWAGELPLGLVASPPLPDELSARGQVLPTYLAGQTRYPSPPLFHQESA